MGQASHTRAILQAAWLCCSSTLLLAQANDAAPPDAGSRIGRVSGEKYTKITPGTSTKAQVKSLLGAPWRTVQYNDMDQLEDEIWEYRGSDADGTYRIHIEFDHHDVVRVVGKIPDRTTDGEAARAKSVGNSRQ